MLFKTTKLFYFCLLLQYETVKQKIIKNHPLTNPSLLLFFFHNSLTKIKMFSPAYPLIRTVQIKKSIISTKQRDSNFFTEKKTFPNLIANKKFPKSSKVTFY